MQIQTKLKDWDIRDLQGRPQKKYRKLRKAYFHKLKCKIKRFLNKFDPACNPQED